MTAFPNLPPDVRGRLEARGIDADRSLQALIVECRVSPPPLLLRDLGLAPIIEERQIIGRMREGLRRMRAA